LKVENSRKFPREFENSGIPGNSRKFPGNQLDQSVVDAGCVDTFKRRVNCYRNVKMDLFMDKHPHGRWWS